MVLFAICQAVKAAQKLPGSTWDLEPAQDCAPERLWRVLHPQVLRLVGGASACGFPQNQTPPAPSTAPDPAQLQRDEEVSSQPQWEGQA